MANRNLAKLISKGIRCYQDHGFLRTVDTVVIYIEGICGRFSLNQWSRLVFIKCHPILLNFACLNAHLIRRFLKTGPVGIHGKKKVLHVTCSFDLGGTQKQILNVCKNGDKGEIFSHEAVEIFPEMNYLYRKGVTLNKDRYIRGSFFTRKLGEAVLNPLERSLQVVQIYKLIRDFRTLRPDIVVGWGHEIAMLSFVAGAIARVPNIVFCIRTFNPSYGWTRIGSLLEKSHKKMEPFLSGTLVNSEILKRDYCGWLGIAPERVHVCPNGIKGNNLNEDERKRYREETRKRYGIDDDTVVILHVGRFSEEKGQMLLMRANKRLRQRYPDNKVCWILCGDGSTQEKVADYVDRNKMTNVFMVGRIDDISPFLCAADMFVMPSDFEGMPNAMMEAMVYGLPCISTNRTGALDVARNNMEALYIEVGSVQQLEEKLSYLITRPEERKRIGANAIARLKEFSVSNMIRTLNKFLERIIYLD